MKKIMIIIAIIFVFIGQYYGSLSYWERSLFDTETLPLHYMFLIFMIKIGFFLLAFVSIIFSNYIYKKRKEIILLIVVSALMFLVVESGSRIYLCKFADIDTMKRFLVPNQCGFKSMYTAHHYLSYVTTPYFIGLNGLNEHNSLGFRGREIEEKKTFRIVTIGGSTTYSTAVEDWRFDFARQLEGKLKEKGYDIEVINAGVGGYSSWETLMNLQFRVLELEPDMITIYENINDVYSRLVNPNYYKADNSGRRKFWEYESPLLLKSTFLRLLFNVNPQSQGIYSDAPTHIRLREDIYSSKLKGKPSEVLEQNSPIYFQNNLKSIIAIANAHNIVPVIATFAYEEDIGYGSIDFYRKAMDEHNEIIRNLENVHVYDFANEMPKDPKLYSEDGIHMNSEGVSIQAKLFANYLINAKLLLLNENAKV